MGEENYRKLVTHTLHPNNYHFPSPHIVEYCTVQLLHVKLV